MNNKYIIFCKDCGKKLGKNAYYLKSQRCKKCRSKHFWKNISYNTKQMQSNLNRTNRDYLYTITILNKLGKEWIIWFTGFWEGEGSLCKCYNNKTKISSWNFAIAQKDNYIRELQKYFKFGKINDYNKNKCLQWLFGGAGHVYAFIEMMYSYIKLPKRKVQICKFLNDKYITNFAKYRLEKERESSNA